MGSREILVVLRESIMMGQIAHHCLLQGKSLLVKPDHLRESIMILRMQVERVIMTDLTAQRFLVQMAEHYAS